MYFEQITTPGLGCFSYVIGCPQAGVMAVVDPRRDIGVYLRITETHGMRVTHIFDTHVHADHISGAQQLRAATGADICIHESAPVGYAAKKVKDGDTFSFGPAAVRVLHTPGHTPNSISLLLSDLARSPEPAMLLTGDLLFVGDIGRPDLPGAEILDEQVHNLYTSLYTTLGQLPDYLEIYPAHGQGSLCGGGMSAKPSTTLGYERVANPMLQHPDFAAFKRAILSQFPLRPQSFSAIIAANMGGPPILPACEPTGETLSADETEALLNAGATLLDLRDRFAFGAAHIPGSINVEAASSSLLNWIGVAVPPGTPLVLLLPPGKTFEEMRIELQRIGYDAPLKGWIKDGMSAWLDSGRDAQGIPHISASALRTRLTSSTPPLLIDVRTLREFERMRIEGALHLPFDRLLERGCPEALETEAVVICQSGFRASIAASLLQAKGCARINLLSGGMNAWQRT